MFTRVLRAAAVSAVAATSIVVGYAASAAAAAPGPTDAGTARLIEIIGRLTGWIIGILAAVATLFLTVGGLRYLAAGGDPAEVERAKGSMRSAAIGYALALLSPVILSILTYILR